MTDRKVIEALLARVEAAIFEQAEGERDLQRLARAARHGRCDALVHMYCAQTLEELPALLRALIAQEPV